jgi:F-type H+-transporting ATPase subunit epsilon
MKTFALDLYDSSNAEHFDGVRQFIGADESGSFGVLAGHEKLVAVLRYGLARFEDAAGNWHYLSMPGGVLHYQDNRMSITSVRYFLGDDRTKICDQLADEMKQADSEVHTAHATLSEIEHALMRRLGELSSKG